MQNSIKILLFICILSSAHNTIYAYRWVINNFTSKLLLVQIELMDSTRPFFVLMQPRKSGDFDWSPGNTMAGFCLGRIKYLIPNEYLLSQKELINRTTMEVMHNEKLLAWLDEHKFVRNEAPINLIVDKLFNQTVEEAQKLTGTRIGAEIVGYFANLVKESKCRGRDIIIVEKNGKIEFYTLAN